MSAKNTPDLSAELAAAVAEYGLAVAEDRRTVSGSLAFGVEHEGAWHFDFVMRLPTVRDDMALDPALEGVPRMLAVYALCLERLGGMPPEALDADALADALHPSDLDVLFFAQELLAKKRRRPSAIATPC
ncbi:hypothetical protein L1281_002399 [Neisseria sp. HSC-16F19]|nr:hypothetical protein [Neisseria sp. HSC-16F19]MCP2041783.1 hypothetical protein [Neisseria sp. HSC-16F19]